MVRTHTLTAVAASLITVASTAAADCIDINADPVERLVGIVHIDEERAGQIVEGRPWPGVRALTRVYGIGRSRIGNILEEGVACAGVRAPRGERKSTEGLATVLDANKFIVPESTR